tara:strand:+ start:1285 stop:1629 length:345 start_codon:yes stop_codon:yes gene_type:complete
MYCGREFIFPLEILSIIKNFLFDYKISFSKVLFCIKKNYPTEIYSTGPRSLAIDIWQNEGVGVWEIIYYVPRYMKMNKQLIRKLGLNDVGPDKYNQTKEHRYFYDNHKNFENYK